MTAIVMKAVAGARGIGDAAQQVVQVAKAASQIMDVVREETAKANEAAWNANNEFNIRKNFLDKAASAIKGATLGQYSIVACTNQKDDDFQDLTGQILPMDLIDVQVSPGETVNFQKQLEQQAAEQKTAADTATAVKSVQEGSQEGEGEEEPKSEDAGQEDQATVEKPEKEQAGEEDTQEEGEENAKARQPEGNAPEDAGDGAPKDAEEGEPEQAEDTPMEAKEGAPESEEAEE